MKQGNFVLEPEDVGGYSGHANKWVLHCLRSRLAITQGNIHDTMLINGVVLGEKPSSMEI